MIAIFNALVRACNLARNILAIQGNLTWALRPSDVAAADTQLFTFECSVYGDIVKRAAFYQSKTILQWPTITKLFLMVYSLCNKQYIREHKPSTRGIWNQILANMPHPQILKSQCESA